MCKLYASYFEKIEACFDLEKMFFQDIFVLVSIAGVGKIQPVG